jgi:hypothetical protein
MAAPVSVHIADLGFPRSLGLRLKPGSVPGLRHADVGLALPLRKTKLPRPTVGRATLIAFWDDDDAIDRFEADHPVAERMRGGWSTRLEPLRRYGAWPGLDDDIEGSRHTDHSGPAVVLTLGRLRLPQAVRFLRTSAKAEAAVFDADGLVWGTAIAKPPFVATCSLWESTRALATYAYGAGDRRHPDAIDVDAAKPFHHRSAFIRFRPYAMRGSLGGKNALPERALEST